VDFFLEKNQEFKRDFLVLHYALPQEKAIERILKRSELE
jgi:hypothetical protein